MDVLQQNELSPDIRYKVLCDVQSYIQLWYEQNFGEEFSYHNWAHTIEVTERAILLGRKAGLSEQSLWELTIAGLFHDAGYSKSYDDHESESALMCEHFLSECGIDESFIRRVCQLILVTKPGVEPVFMEEKIIKDADLANVGNPQYFEQLESLRREWEHFKSEVYSDEEWLKLNRRFLKEHQFYTAEAYQLYSDQKLANLKLAKKKIEKIERKQDIEEVLHKAVKDSRSAQLIFKTSLRNQIDLTNIADNKANIMLSINAIIITISLPLLAANMRSNIYILIPASVLLTTCVVSIIFATLVTRPIKMSGITQLDLIKEGKTNLFFFGNFYKMDYESYVKGLKEVISRDEYIDQSIFKDLYNLGKSLGAKYTQLRTCYTIFMAGVIASVLSFAITYFMGLI